MTAGNASSINDGAAALLMMSEDAAKSSNTTVLGNVLGFADAEQEATKFTTTPTLAVCGEGVVRNNTPSVNVSKVSLALPTISYPR
mgnify:CR=1 FL=1